MTSIGLLRRKLPLFALALGWLLSAVLLQAQTAGTGTVQGRVFNPVSKDYVGNAEVRLAGTPRVTYSESDGSFQFANVPAGTAAISVIFTGYITVNDSFTVTAGQTAVREINLVSAATPAPSKDGVIQLTAFTVATEREGNAKAIQAQRRNMNITTSVSSDIFGDVADGNVGEFLKYLPGVDLDYVESEARGPRLGGMDGQYVGVSFDGNRTASADANRGGGSASRATSFEGFSITSIDSIEINRTSSPENDADSPAGTINMKTKRAFERKGRRFDYNYGLNLNGEEFTLRKTAGIRDTPSFKWKNNYQVGYSESFFDQRFGILLSASHANSYTEQNAVTVDYNRGSPTDPRPLVARQIDFGDGPKFIVKDALLLTADWKATKRLVLSVNLIYSYFEGEFWNRNFTFIAANNNANVNNGRGTVGGDGILSITAPPRDALANVATVNNGGGSSAKLIYSRQYAPRFEYKIGDLVVDGSIAFSKAVNNYESLERGFTNSEGGGVPGGWTATRPNPQSWEFVLKQDSGSDWTDLRSFTNATGNNALRDGGTRVNNDDRTWITEKWTGNLNSKWVVPFMNRFPTSIKFGGKWDEESRKNRTDSPLNIWSYVGPGGNTTAVNPITGANQNVTFGNWADVGSKYISPFLWDSGTTDSLKLYSVNGSRAMLPRANRQAIGELFKTSPGLFVNTSTPNDYFSANYANARNFRQVINAGYIQADVRITSKFQIRFGVRAEQTKNALTEFDPRTRAEVLAAGYAADAVGTNNGRATTIPGLQYQFESKSKVVRRKTYTNWFPSIVAKYQILPELEWQAGVNKGISRPGIDDLTGLRNVNESNFTVNSPNPNLLPEYHKVYQTRLAYYFGNKSPGQVSIAYIVDEAENFTLTRNLSASEFGETDPDFAPYTFITKINDPLLQRYKNLDFNYQQTLGFLPSIYLKGLGVGATYSRSYANQRRNFLAPHRATASLSYTYKRFSGRVGGIWIDDRPVDSVYGRVWGAMTKLDISATWKLTRYASLYVQVRNPTNQKDLYYESPPGTQEGKGKVLRRMEAYGDNWVFGVKGSF
jgi:iron complex outermembrane receptor protein